MKDQNVAPKEQYRNESSKDSEDINKESFANHEKSLRSPLSEIQNHDDQPACSNNQAKTDGQKENVFASESDTMNEIEQSPKNVDEEYTPPNYYEPPPSPPSPMDEDPPVSIQNS